MKRFVAGVAAAAAVFGLGLAATGTAQATTYCPGQGYLAKDPWPGFDRSVCHNYHYDMVDGRPGNVDDDTGIFHPWQDWNPAPVDPNAPHGTQCIGLVPIGDGDWRQCYL